MTVVLVHGFLSHGVGMYLVKCRLEREYGMRVRVFSYPSVRSTLDENAAALTQFIDEQGQGEVHVVGHSLGGIVALRSLVLNCDAYGGRLVCLGSPLTGSRTGEALIELPWANDMLENVRSDRGVQQPASDWASSIVESREIGVIAGTVSIGMGRLLTEFDEDNDGTVAVSETMLPGAKDHLTMPVSHKGLLLSAEVADQAAAFLRRGEFLRETG